jgi:multiple sugar transport system permease protein
VAATPVSAQRRGWLGGGWMAKQNRREALAGYLFILPTFVGYTAFVVGPLLAAVGYSFTEYDALTDPTYVGVDNYQRLWEDDRLHTVYRNTFTFSIFAVVLNIALGLLLAVLINRRMPRFLRYIFRSAFFFPVLVAHVYIAIIWQFLYNKDLGIINFYLGDFGIDPIPWLNSRDWAMPSVIIMDVWKNAGFAMLICLAGLQNIPEVYHEAASLDGASAWQRFRNITFPLLTPTLFFLVVIYAIGALQVFDSIFVLTEGGPGDATRSIVMYLRETAFESFEMGYASAVAMTLFLVIMVLTLVQFRLGRRWVHYE